MKPFFINRYCFWMIGQNTKKAFFLYVIRIKGLILTKNNTNLWLKNTTS